MLTATNNSGFPSIKFNDFERCFLAKPMLRNDSGIPILRADDPLARKVSDSGYSFPSITWGPLNYEILPTQAHSILGTFL